jgi:hypothetical protein
LDSDGMESFLFGQKIYSNLIWTLCSKNSSTSSIPNVHPHSREAEWPKWNENGRMEDGIRERTRMAGCCQLTGEKWRNGKGKKKDGRKLTGKSPKEMGEGQRWPNGRGMCWPRRRKLRKFGGKSADKGKAGRKLRIRMNIGSNLKIRTFSGLWIFSEYFRIDSVIFILIYFIGEMDPKIAKIFSFEQNIAWREDPFLGCFEWAQYGRELNVVKRKREKRKGCIAICSQFDIWREWTSFGLN